MDDRGYLIFHDKRSSDFGMWVNLDNAHPHSNRNITLTDIPGRSGNLLQDNNGSRSNAQLQIKVDIELPARFNDFYDLEDAIVDWLDGDDYSYLGFSWKPRFLYHAVVVTFPEFTPNLSTVPEQEQATLTFECEPWKYVTQSIKWQPLPKSQKIVNDYKITYPDWHIVGTGDFSLNVAGFPYLINGLDGEIYIDGQTAQAYAGDGTDLSSSVQWANNDAPSLLPGDNVVALTVGDGATLTKAEWKPKYRRVM